MYRTAASRVRAIKGRAGSRALIIFASSSAVATSSSSSGGLFSWLIGDKSKTLPPLDFPLSNVALPPALPDYVEPSKVKITTISSGVKIASETSAENPAASIGLYVDCRSIYETPISFGATHLLERMAFKSTINRSHLRVIREVEAIGGNVTASASREQMGYTFDALKTYVPEMVELRIDSVRNPAFLDWEVSEQLEKVKAEIGEASNNPQGLLLEALHSAGYSGALANPLLAPESAINRLDSTNLEEFVALNYTAPRMVVAASGVEHEELLSVAEPLLSDLPSVPRPEEPKSVYVGGDYRCQADSGKTHFALAFEVPGGWHKEKEAMTLTVLQMLMGGGGSFSAGGPGKGMYSRLWSQPEKLYSETNELVLDGGFLVQKDGFMAPEINSFGNSFRDYDAESERQKTVEEFYRINHINQTYDFVKKMREAYGKLDRVEMSIWECCELLNDVIDDSDPDLVEPQIEHLLQTAEAIRKDYPNEDWLHLTGLIHDLGKVLLHPSFGELPQWAVVGDTFPLGCAFDEANVHHKYFKENPDYNNPNYSTKNGIYSEGCGLDNVMISWGHDDYMYLVAKENKSTLPPAALFIIRYHSFYPLHRYGAYKHLMNEEDVENLKWLHIFNKYDLYSKSKVRIDVEKVKPYYLSLIEKYFPAKLRW